MSLEKNLFALAKVCIDTPDPDDKINLVNELLAQWFLKNLDCDSSKPVISIPAPGRPSTPALVAFIATPARRLGDKNGKAAFIHAIAHIEFNAINLAMDAVYRFRGLPESFYSNWLKVAVEEGRHFKLLSDRLQSLGFQYGDFNAHNGLWEMAMLTEHSLLERMALVPRLLEARGLDVTPKMIQRLKSLGDLQTVSILETILNEEIGHVSIGTRWYNYACEKQGVDPELTFVELLEKHHKIPLPGPLNSDARLLAGFSQDELNLLLKTE